MIRSSAFESPLAGLIIENTFTRVVDVVPHTLPFLATLVGPGRCGMCAPACGGRAAHIEPHTLSRTHRPLR